MFGDDVFEALDFGGTGEEPWDAEGVADEFLGTADGVDGDPAQREYDGGEPEEEESAGYYFQKEAHQYSKASLRDRFRVTRVATMTRPNRTTATAEAYPTLYSVNTFW